MSLKLHKMISLISEQVDHTMSSQTYNDIIHGRKPLMHQQMNNIDFEDVPIKINKSKWEHVETANGEVLVRTFIFLNFQTLFYFVAESLKLQERLSHHCVMTIDELTIDVAIQTKDLQEVTESDLMLSARVNDIYEDTQYFHAVGSDERS